jgi:hypothetical protein
MTKLAKLIYRFKASLIRILIFLIEIGSLFLKFVWKFKGPRKTRTVLGKKMENGILTFSDFEIYYKSIIIKIV